MTKSFKLYILEEYLLNRKEWNILFYIYNLGKPFILIIIMIIALIFHQVLKITLPNRKCGMLNSFLIVFRAKPSCTPYILLLQCCPMDYKHLWGTGKHTQKTCWWYSHISKLPQLSRNFYSKNISLHLGWSQAEPVVMRLILLILSFWPVLPLE